MKMVRMLCLVLGFLLGLTAFCEDADQNMKIITSYVQEACGDAQITKQVMDELRKCMNEAEESRKKKEEVYLSRKRELAGLKNKVTDNDREIAENEQKIKKLEGITRDEFEDPADFCKRQESAKHTIDELRGRNKELEIGSRQIRSQIDEREKEETPRLEFDFSGRYAISVHYGTNEIQMGTFDVKKKVFPCRFRGRTDELKKNGCFYDFSITRSPEEFLMGPFDSNEKAKSAKQDFLAGTKKWNSECKCEFLVSIRKGIKSVKIKEGGRKAKLGDQVKYWGTAACGALLAWAMDDRSVLQRMNLTGPSTYEVPPVYETYDAFNIDCKIRFLPKEK